MPEQTTECAGEMQCHVLPYEAAVGASNMALDEALLEWVAAGAAVRPICGLTGSTAPTLSLGYFQRLAEVQADPRFQSVPLVRRLTGGGAIWHHNELTYALIAAANYIPRTSLAPGLYQRVHAAIVDLLLEVGISATPDGVR